MGFERSGRFVKFSPLNGVSFRSKRSGSGQCGENSSSISDEHDFGPEAKLMFEVIKITGERFGLGTPVGFLTGSVSIQF